MPIHPGTDSRSRGPKLQTAISIENQDSGQQARSCASGIYHAERYTLDISHLQLAGLLALILNFKTVVSDPQCLE